MFERFTDGARKAVTDAQVVARRLGHDRIGTEHVLLGLVEGDGVAARVLGGLGVTSAAVEREILAEVGRGPLGSRDAEATPPGGRRCWAGTSRSPRGPRRRWS